MLGVLQSVAAFVVVLGILITVHEFGHYWVARRMDVKILRFSIGFGRPLWTRVFGDDRTELVVAALPLGGYVRMLDEREGEVEPSERDRAFNRKPLAARIAVVVAGPAFNFLFAIAAYWAMFVIGTTGLRPVIGEVEPGSLAERAGFRSGLELVSVEGLRTPTWESVLHAGIGEIVDRGAIRFEVRDPDGRMRDIEVDTSALDLDSLSTDGFFSVLGLKPERPRLRPVIDEVVAGGAAERAGIRPGDRILSADGVEMETWQQWVNTVRTHPGQPLQFVIDRDGVRIHGELTPEAVEEEGARIGRIGVSVRVPETFPEDYRATERYSPGVALGRALSKTWDMSALTLKILGRMIVGEASVRNLSGPITIARYAGQSADIGLAAFLSFMAIVSVSLGVLNLLPIPLLDGGHLLYYLFEAVKGSPVSEQAQIFGQKIGVAVLLGLMSLAFYNDIARWLGQGGFLGQ